MHNLDQLKINEARKLLSEVAGDGGAYCLLVQIGSPKQTDDSQIWFGGSTVTVVGLAEAASKMALDRLNGNHLRIETI